MDVLDTNVIIRHVTQDNLDQSERASALLLEVESGARDIYLSEAVIVETVQVLSSRVLYNLPRDQIGVHLSRVLNLPGVQIPFRRAVHRALDLYVSNGALSFVDCLCVAHAERLGDGGVLSFDRGFHRSSLLAETAVRRIDP